MEERLKELRLAMNREKEDRERQGGGYWSRGQTGNLNSYATDVLNKPSSTKGKKKVKVLKDTPLDIPDRPSQPGTMAHIAKQEASVTPRQKVKGPKCGQCEEKKAAVSCVQCSELYCPPCFASFHLRGALKKHRSIPISATGPRQCMSPRPTPPHSIRDSYDYHQPPQEAASNSQHYYSNRIRDHDRNSPEGASGSFDGPSLLKGDYNEADSAASFQEALRAWRSGNSEGQNGHASTPGSVQSARSIHTPRVISVETPRVDSGTETQKPPPVEIKFHSNLSYAERLLLKKHRRTEVEQTDTPRVQAPPSPHLPTPSSPRDTYMGVEMPVTPRNAATPRIESYPKRGQSGMDIDDDFDDEERVNFQALYDAVKSTNPNVKTARKDEDNISIIELTNDVRANPLIDETSKCLVQEATELEAWAENVQKLTSTLRSELSTTMDSKPPSAKSEKMTGSKLNNEKSNVNTGKESNLKSRPSSSMKSRPASSMKSRPSSAKSRPVSAANRAKSRAMSSKPGSRSNSRAGSRMEGEGVLTKKPSEALHQVAQMTADHAEPRSVPLEQLFMIGVQPEPVERTMTPSKHKDQKEEKIKVSNKLYQMAPRSWRPDSSLADNVSEYDVRIDPVPDPLYDMSAELEVSTLMDKAMANLSASRSTSLLDGFTEDSPTPRGPSRSDTQTDTRNRRQLPSTPLYNSKSSPSNSPRPPSQSKALSPRQRSNLSRPSSQVSTSSQKSLRRSKLEQAIDFSRTVKSPEYDETASPVNIPQDRLASAASRGVTPHNAVPHVSTVPTPRSARATPRTITPRHQAPRTPRTMTPRQHAPSTPRATTQRSHSSFGERPESRAIVVDGEDLSNYDAMGELEKQNQDDEETLEQLEWELASASGRLTADGKISRMSALPDSDNEDDDVASSCSSETLREAISRLSQHDLGYDINTCLRWVWISHHVEKILSLKSSKSQNLFTLI
ncbi:hypothetical protein FSP39_018981 [Pinctada imbricata]|uniref:B box-type domain-containing protein n=1 Tax=Pinctada imbricata TaxID=66713 RepID=A0AA89C5R4_PINIB|nr:hypothetical protein FSP39_018981 [Pinctada imbricata]